MGLEPAFTSENNTLYFDGLFFEKLWKFYSSVGIACVWPGTLPQGCYIRTFFFPFLWREYRGPLDA